MKITLSRKIVLPKSNDEIVKNRWLYKEYRNETCMVSGSISHCQAPTAVQMEIRTKRTEKNNDTIINDKQIHHIKRKYKYLTTQLQKKLELWWLNRCTHLSI